MSEAASLSTNSPAPANSGGVGLGVQIGYGFGQIAGQVFRDLPSLLLMFFMTTVLGISPAIAGMAIFVPKLLWGATADLLVGVYSDRLRYRIPRRWWLLVGVVGAPITMILLFHVPEGSVNFKAAYVSAVFTLYMGVFACFSVPYLAMAGDYTSSPAERNVIMAWRLVFTAIGISFSGMIAPYLIGEMGGDQAAHEKMSYLLAVVCPVALLVTFITIGRVKSNAPAPVRGNVADRLTFRQAVTVLAKPKFLALVVSTLLLLTSGGMGYATLLYFLSYNMGRPDAYQLIAAVVAAACVGIILAQPLWVKLAKTFGKRNSFLIGSAIYTLSYVVWCFGASWGVAISIFISFVAAIGNSGYTMLGFSMLSDISAEDSRNAGLYSAIWIATDKIAFALGGTLLVGLVLTLFGFDSTRAVQGLPQTDMALLGVQVAFGIIPGFLGLAAFLIMLKFVPNTK